MSDAAKDKKQSVHESYHPDRPSILYYAEEYQKEVIKEIITYRGAVLEVVERPEAVFCGKIAYAQNLTDEPDIETLLKDYQKLVPIPKNEPVAPEWTAAISIDYWRGGIVPRGMMFGQEVAAEKQPEVYDIYKMPKSLYMRVFHDADAAKALDKDQCDIWELYGLMKDIVMPLYGYRFNENGAQEFEYYNWTKYSSGFAYVPVIKG